MSYSCNRALIASHGFGTYNRYCSHSTYRYSLWHSLHAFAAVLEPLLIMQATTAIESMPHCDPGPASVSLWQEYSRAICPVSVANDSKLQAACSVQAGVRACRKLSADFSELQGRLWADSHRTEMGFSLQTQTEWCFHRVHSSVYKGLSVTGNKPTLSLCKPTSLQKGYLHWE